ncbi:hypothetical protein, partial [Escherichia coli]|uniref:hypothetical protein n=1 Tax=Escherichia coli TaxID=562 RepID=UPI00374F9013
WKGWAIFLRQKQKKLIMLPSEIMIWQPEFTDKTLSRKPGAVHSAKQRIPWVFTVIHKTNVAMQNNKKRQKNPSNANAFECDEHKLSHDLLSPK